MDAGPSSTGRQGRELSCEGTAERPRVSGRALPTLQDVHDGVIASRIAAHAADIVKGVPGAAEWDLSMARARKALDWEAQMDLAIDPETARAKRAWREAADTDACSMCGNYCAVKIVNQYMEQAK